MSIDLKGPASTHELQAARWLEQVVTTRDTSLAKYTPAPMRSEMSHEYDSTLEVSAPLGVLRHLHTYIARLKAREIR